MTFTQFTYHAGLCPAHPEERAGSSDDGATMSFCLECSREKQKAEGIAEQKAQAEARRVKEIAARIASCRIPARFADKSFWDYSPSSGGQRSNLEKCQDYAENFDTHYADGRCLILSGTVGTGKTHLAIAILKDAVEKQGYTGKYWTVNGLLQVIRSSYEKDSGFSESDVISSVTDTHLLVLDEVGATKQSEFEMATLFNIINSRYEWKLPTIIISNLGPKQIGEAIGERCFDRLREGGSECLVFQGESNRKK
jgi:DNA replication protein